MNQASGKVVVITGSSRGIGAATAQNLAAAGATVVLTAQTAAACAKTAAAIAAAGGSATSYGFDVGDADACADFAGKVTAVQGPIDILINNAGVGALGTVDEISPAAFARIMAINVAGPYNMIHAVLPGMLARDAGVIVNLTSVRARMPARGYGAYCASKAALMAQTQCLHLETEGTGVRLYAFAPGLTATDMLDEVYGRPDAPNAIPREWAQPVDRPAHVLAWLAMTAPADLAGTEVAVQHNDITRRAGLEAEQ